MNSNPLIVSNIYNKDGYLSLRYTRIKAIHFGWCGNITKNLDYRAKFSFNKTWGTPFYPTDDILENFSALAEIIYNPNKKIVNWQFKGSIGFDMGDLYGNNIGFQLKIRRIIK